MMTTDIESVVQEPPMTLERVVARLREQYETAAVAYYAAVAVNSLDVDAVWFVSANLQDTLTLCKFAGAR